MKTEYKGAFHNRFPMLLAEADWRVTTVVVLMLTHIIAGLIAIYVLPAMTKAK